MLAVGPWKVGPDGLSVLDVDGNVVCWATRAEDARQIAILPDLLALAQDGASRYPANDPLPSFQARLDSLLAPFGGRATW